MVSLSLISEFSRHMIALWAFMLFTLFVVFIVQALFQKRYVFACVNLIPFAFTYLIWQLFLALNIRNGRIDVEIAKKVLENTPWLIWIAVLLALTFTMILLLARSIRYEKNHITPNAIKLCADHMPCGICYWRENGRVIFSNDCMNRLCNAMTNKPLLNGNHFSKSFAGGYQSVGGVVWQFCCRELTLDGETIHEMIASDVSEEYAKTELLRKDTEELSRLNVELQEHRLKIAETIRKQEVLQAKVNIHDEMNRLMLRTVVADSQNKEELDAVFSLWKQNALLLCMEAETDKMNLEKSENLAKLLNIRLVWLSELPGVLTDKQRELFFSALGEAIINASKHANANSLSISFALTGDGLSCTFENDGIVSDDIPFRGGLSNLSLLANEQNANIFAEADKTFKLTLTFTI